MGAKGVGSQRAIKGFVMLVAVPLLLASTLAVSPVAAAASSSLHLPATQGATQRFIVTVASDSDVAEIGHDLESVGATVHERFTKVFSGLSVSLTTAQAMALADDHRVTSIEIDELVSLDSFEASTQSPSVVGDVIPGRYIITLRPTANQTAKDNVLTILGDSIIANFSYAIRGYSADLSPTQLKALEGSPAI